MQKKNNFRALYNREEKKYRFYVYYGGRGSGKSEGVAEYLIMYALLTECKILCAREIQRSIKDSVFSLLCRKIAMLEEQLDCDLHYCFTNNEITNKLTGSSFIFKGLYRNVTSIRSLDNVNICWIEEAQTISNDTLSTLIPTLRQEDSFFIMTGNPMFKTDAFSKRYIENDNDEGIYKKKLNYNDNPYFPAVLEEERKRDKKTQAMHFYEHVWNGAYLNISTNPVFGKKIEIMDFNACDPNYGQFYAGIDFGFSKDPTALVLCSIKDNILYIHKELYEYGMCIDQIPNRISYLNIDYILHSIKIYADCARPDIIEIMQRAYVTEGCYKPPYSIKAGVDKILSFDKIVIHSECKNAQKEFKFFSYKENPTRTMLFNDNNNHIIDAVRYALQDEIYIKQKPFEYEKLVF